MAWAARGRSSAVFGPSVHRGGRTRPEIALTFDDGPSESTPALLEILAAHGVPATFFQCGANVLRLPAVAREVAPGTLKSANEKRASSSCQRFTGPPFARAVPVIAPRHGMGSGLPLKRSIRRKSSGSASSATSLMISTGAPTPNVMAPRSRESMVRMSMLDSA